MRIDRLAYTLAEVGDPLKAFLRPLCLQLDYLIDRFPVCSLGEPIDRVTQRVEVPDGAQAAEHASICRNNLSNGRPKLQESSPIELSADVAAEEGSKIVNVGHGHQLIKPSRFELPQLGMQLQPSRFQTPA